MNDLPSLASQLKGNQKASLSKVNAYDDEQDSKYEEIYDMGKRLYTKYDH